MEKEEFIKHILDNYSYLASISEQLTSRRRVLLELVKDERVKLRLIEDPVFFSILMCNDKWLADAPDHQKLLRDNHPRQVAVCGRGWGKSLVLSRKNRRAVCPAFARGFCLFQVGNERLIEANTQSIRR